MVEFIEALAIVLAVGSTGRALPSLLVDDLPLAVGIAGRVGATALMQSLHPAGGEAACGLFAAGLAAALAFGAWHRAAHAA